MFPIRDHNPSGKVPYVTYALMIANIGIFLSYAASLGNDRIIYNLYDAYALVPARIGAGYASREAFVLGHGLLGRMTGCGRSQTNLPFTIRRKKPAPCFQVIHRKKYVI